MDRKSRSTGKRVAFETMDDGTIRARKAEIPQWYNDILAFEGECLHQSWWWQRYEIDSIRMRAQEIAESVAGRGKDRLWSRSQSRLYRNTITRVHRHSVRANPKQEVNLDPSLRGDLEFWMCMGSSVRGLEKYILHEILSCRDHRRQQVRRAVLYIQEKGKRENLSSEQTSDLIQVASELISRSAKRFAGFMGQADEMAAMIEHYCHEFNKHQVKEQQKRKKATTIYKRVKGRSKTKSVPNTTRRRQVPPLPSERVPAAA